MGKIRQEEILEYLPKCRICGNIFVDKDAFDGHLARCLENRGWRYVILTMSIQVMLFGPDEGQDVRVSMKVNNCSKEQYDRNIWKIGKHGSFLGQPSVSVSLPDDSPENIAKGLDMLKAEVLETSEDRFGQVQRKIRGLTVDKIKLEDEPGCDVKVDDLPDEDLSESDLEGLDPALYQGNGMEESRGETRAEEPPQSHGIQALGFEVGPADGSPGPLGR